jgi:hypothetical protein
MDEAVKKWIRKKVSNTYNKYNLDSAIEALEQFISVCPKGDMWETRYSSMWRASDDEKEELVKNFADIEIFLKQLVDFVSPGKLEIPPFGNPDKEWMLASVYKLFYLFPPRGDYYSDLRSLNDYSSEQWAELKRKLRKVSEDKGQYYYHYIRLYIFRNKIIHNERFDLTDEVILEATRAAIITELYTCELHKKTISQKYKDSIFNEQFDRDEYVRSIREKYSQRERMGFKYINILWSVEDESESSISINDILEQPTKAIRISGAPGTGKSTALIQMEHLLIENLASSYSRIPVYIELSDSTEDEGYIVKKVAQKLNVKDYMVGHLLENGKLVLLLDGYNEILDSQIKKRISKEIDSISRSYNSLIILTDRGGKKREIPVLYNAKEIVFAKMNKECVQNFIVSYCKEESTKDTLINKSNAEFSVFSWLNTPLKLLSLIDYVDRNNLFPNNYIKVYIDYLFERELFEKKDDRISNISRLLQALANDMESDSMPYNDALLSFKKCKDNYGIQTLDTDKCLQLCVDMGILLIDNDQIYFVEDEYKNQFFMDSFSKGGLYDEQ